MEVKLQSPILCDWVKCTFMIFRMKTLMKQLDNVYGAQRREDGWLGLSKSGVLPDGRNKQMKIHVLRKGQERFRMLIKECYKNEGSPSLNYIGRKGKWEGAGIWKGTGVNRLTDVIPKCIRPNY